MNNPLIEGDCLSVLPTLPERTYRLVMLDMPYGFTNLAYDKEVVGKGKELDYRKQDDRLLMTNYLQTLWQELERVCLPNAVVVATSSKLFTGVLQSAWCGHWVDEAVWTKTNHTNFGALKTKQPAKMEAINVFCFGSSYVFNAIEEEWAGKPYKGFSSNLKTTGKVTGAMLSKHRDNPTGKRYKGGVFEYARATGISPTQKPVGLWQDLIGQYSNEGDFVLDPYAGSGTTAIACQNLGRVYTCIEKDAVYYEKMCSRVKQNEKKLYGDRIETTA